MKYVLGIIWGTYLVLFLGCSGGKYLELTKEVESSYLENDYTKTLERSEQIIGEVESRGKMASGEVYSFAGASAFELEEYDKSLNYLEKARGQDYYGEEMYYYLARNYRHIDNLSKEIGSLESYIGKYPQGKYIGEMQTRLFQTCLESENFELADELWAGMDSLSRDNVANLEVYLNINRIQEKNELCNTLGKRLLDKDADNESGLRWFGETCFWRAENSYLSEMKAYRETRTHKQYAILLESFKQVNSDFRKSRDYFLKLYSLYPKPDYASYLANIYTRLEDEEKAAYYKKRAA
jgi:tetratricopeptide (TPR) repeat protein